MTTVNDIIKSLKSAPPVDNVVIDRATHIGIIGYKDGNKEAVYIIPDVSLIDRLRLRFAVWLWKRRVK